MRLALLMCLLIGALPARADQWAFLHWETIDVASCQVAEVVVESIGDPHHQVAYWRADSFGTRRGGSEWKLMLGQFEDTEKGFDKAHNLCHEFTLRAMKEIKKSARRAPKQ